MAKRQPDIKVFFTRNTRANGKAAPRGSEATLPHEDAVYLINLGKAVDAGKKENAEIIDRITKEVKAAAKAESK